MLETSSTSTARIIPFPSRGLPGQHDLFLGPSGTIASTGIVGLTVKMLHRPCRSCGSTAFTITSSAAMHHAGLRCVECDRHGGWLSAGAFTFIEMTIARFETDRAGCRAPFRSGRILTMGNLRPIPGTPPDLTTALKYSRRGIRIFPCNTEKRPLIDSWLNASSADEKQIEQWWTDHPDALIGLPMKHLGLLVVDCDRHNVDQDGVALFASMVAKHGELPAHPIIRTPNNGEHHIFRQPADCKIGNKTFAPGIDTRGYKPENDGGYVIGAGSELPDGRGWKPFKGSPFFLKMLTNGLAEPSPWLTETLKEAPKPPARGSASPATKREEKYAQVALDKIAAEVAATGEGERNNKLNAAAFAMGTMVARDWIGRATVEGRLTDSAHANGLIKDDGTQAVTGTIRSGIDAGLKSPHADLEDRPRQPMAVPMKEKVPPQASSSEPIRRPMLHSWDDPDISLLDDRRGALLEFPIDVFSLTLQAMLKRTAKGAGVTVAHVAVPFIGITSGLIGYSRRVKAANSWFEPATCCTALVGYSGTGKTPAHNVTRKPLRAVERLQKEKEEKRKRDHETKRAKAKAEYDYWKAKVEEAVEAGSPAPDMPASAVDPGKYVPLRLVVNDSTVERLAELLQARPHGIVLVRDELAALYMNMSRYNGGQDDEFWLESWNGQPHTVERMGRMLDIDHLLIGVVGGLQPDKLVASFEGDHDGKYARVLFAWPDEPEWLGLSNEATEIDVDIQNIISRILTLAEFDGDRLLPLVIALDAEAEDEFEQFAQFAHQEKKALEGREREWWAKATAHVLRLVNTLTYVEWGLTVTPEKPGAVSKATMQAAIRMVRDYFWPHARACLRLIGLTEKHTNAKRALTWIRAKGKIDVSREDIRRDALGQRLDAAQTDDLLKGLCASGWLREEVTPPGPQGGKPVRRWLVNPKLHNHPTAQTALTAETG